MSKNEVTGNEAGISGDEQIKIALRLMVKNGGVAAISEIYKAIENEMGAHRLSEQGQASLRTFINRDAVKKEFVSFEDPNWRITPAGREHIAEIVDGDFIEPEEVSQRDADEWNIEKPYDPTQIKVLQKSFDVSKIMKRIDKKEINLNPEFQRSLVWSEVQQSRLIESLLIRIPLPAFYMDATNSDEWLVVDGLQRLTTLDRFFNKKDLKLQGLEYLKDLEGKGYDDLPRNFQRDIEDTDLYINIIQPGTPTRVKFTIFSRINTGGSVLTSQEIRHALFQGPATILLKKLSESLAFKEATTYSIDSLRMNDRELVLRFFAFHLIGYKEYKSNFEEFLNDAMETVNTLPENERKDLAASFRSSMDKVREIFGAHAFRKMYTRQPARRAPINKSLFETWSVLVYHYSEKQLVDNKDKILDAFVRLLNESSEFNGSISQGTGSKSNVVKRFSAISSLLEEAIK